MQGINKKYRLIAFYLPQFHPTPDNDNWWGKGFTEWVNVAAARPLFKGHKQPKLPADLGFYDLRLSETRQAQAEMAARHGIEGFCYWHYWFGNGKRLLERPFNEVLQSGTPNFPFCLGWANHSWYAKKWDPGTPDKLLIKQQYSGITDYERHFNEMLPAFKDKRYIKVEGKLFFLIFAPLDNTREIKSFMETWQHLAHENGLVGFYFVGQGDRKHRKEIMNLGFNAFQDSSLYGISKNASIYRRFTRKVKRLLFHTIGKVYDYSTVMSTLQSPDYADIDFIPTIYSNWDHTPRSKERGMVLTNDTPAMFGHHVRKVLHSIKDKPEQLRIAMIKSWNEWGEGNYLEPDREYGTQRLEELQKAIEAET